MHVLFTRKQKCMYTYWGEKPNVSISAGKNWGMFVKLWNHVDCSNVFNSEQYIKKTQGSDLINTIPANTCIKVRGKSKYFKINQWH